MSKNKKKWCHSRAGGNPFRQKGVLARSATWIPAFAGMTMLCLLLALTAQAEDRLGCEIRLNKVIAAADNGNQCNDASDCRYVKIQDCVRGCAILPVHWGMYERIDIAADDYQATCSSSCRAACSKPVEPKCVKNKCDYGLRKWKFLTKEPQSLRE